MILTNKILDKVFKNAKELPLNETSKYILFSDCHRGDNSFADDFKHNRSIFVHALKKYHKQNFTYIELGDGDELWENNFKEIFKKNKEVYSCLKLFHQNNRLELIFGNHDIEYRKPKKIRKNYDFFFDYNKGENIKFMPNINFSEGIKLVNKNGQSILLIHGHQADIFNYTFWKLSRFLVRFFWRPLQIIGIKDPTSPAQNFKELIKVEQRIEHWIQKNNNQMIIAGHTHRPRFPKENQTPYFNDGSCVHPRCITGIEIENNQISLIKWHNITNEDGTIQTIKSLLAGPKNLSLYLNQQ